MKTIKEIQEDLVAIKEQITDGGLKPAEERRLRKRIPFLNMCIMYLEHNPPLSFLNSEHKKVQTKIDRRMALFIFDDLKVDKKTVAKMRKAHEKQYEVAHLREQLKALKFLIKD